MLTPARPDKGDPRYQERMQQYRRDLEDKKQHPQNWGVVRNAPPAPRESAGRAGRKGAAE